MGEHEGSSRTPRGTAARHRRTGQALIERRDHTAQKPSRRLALPAPTPSALVGIAVLVLIAVGVIHLSSTGSAVPVDDPGSVVAVPSGASGEPDAETAEAAGGAPIGSSDDDADGADGAGTNGSASAGASPDAGGAGAPGDADGPEELVVHVSGAVADPGVVRLSPGARVDDALSAAGGPRDDADLESVNLARPLADGEQIHVAVPGEDPPAGAAPAPGAAPPPASGGAPETSSSTGGDGALINLNTADVAQLEELPGVGPAIAQRILEHREKNGPFTSVDGLLEVSGIGAATLEKIRDQATV